MTPAIARRRIEIVLAEIERLQASVRPSLRGSEYSSEAITILNRIEHNARTQFHNLEADASITTATNEHPPG